MKRIENQRKVSAWGHSLVVVLPKPLVKEISIQQGDRMTFDREGDQLVITLQRRPQRAALIAGMLPGDQEAPELDLPGDPSEAP